MEHASNFFLDRAIHFFYYPVLLCTVRHGTLMYDALLAHISVIILLTNSVPLSCSNISVFVPLDLVKHLELVHLSGHFAFVLHEVRHHIPRVIVHKYQHISGTTLRDLCIGLTSSVCTSYITCNVLVSERDGNGSIVCFPFEHPAHSFSMPGSIARIQLVSCCVLSSP